MQVSQMRFAVYYLSIYLSNETDNKKLQRILNNSQYNKWNLMYRIYKNMHG